MTATERRWRPVRATEPSTTPSVVVLALGAVAIAVATFSEIGSDALWLSALGDTIRTQGRIPAGVPFAAAPSDDWVNTTALGQLIFSALHVAGSVGIIAAQVVAVTATLGVLVASSLRRGARASGTVTVLVLVLFGGAAPLLIARAQLLSLLPYAALLILLRAEHDRPSRLIWGAVPLIALWGNLHGAVLVGLAVLGCYLALSRLRLHPWTTVAVGLSSLAAACLNPGLLGGPHYYLGVFGGAATSDDSGMWSALSLTNPFDLLLLAASLGLGYLGFRRRRPVWERAAALGLAAATVTAARHGIWLLIFLIVPACVALLPSQVHLEPRSRTSRQLSAATAVVCAVVVACLLAVRAPTFRAADAEASQLALATRGEVALVPEPFAESMAAAGARLWISNPLDAFNHADQTAYLAFLKGDAIGGRDALARADVVVARHGSAAARAASASGYAESETVGAYVLFRRT